MEKLPHIALQFLNVMCFFQAESTISRGSQDLIQGSVIHNFSLRFIDIFKDTVPHQNRSGKTARLVVERKEKRKIPLSEEFPGRLRVIAASFPAESRRFIKKYLIPARLRHEYPRLRTKNRSAATICCRWQRRDILFHCFAAERAARSGSVIRSAPAC